MWLAVLNKLIMVENKKEVQDMVLAVLTTIRGSTRLRPLGP